MYNDIKIYKKFYLHLFKNHTESMLKG